MSGCDRGHTLLRSFRDPTTRDRTSGGATLLLFQALSFKGLPECTPFYPHFDPRSASSICPCFIAIEQRHVVSSADDLRLRTPGGKLVAEGTMPFITHEQVRSAYLVLMLPRSGSSFSRARLLVL
jgi:hypothetical protein